jgi:predicted aldo/keto reductase-like oxidoreductase
MSRCINLQLGEAEVLKHCAKQGVGVSVIEPLASGGVRLVCMSSGGAEQIRRHLKTKIIDGETIRTRIRPRGARL